MDYVKTNGNDLNDHDYTVGGVTQTAQDFACTEHAGAHSCKYITDGSEKDACSHGTPGLESCQDWIDHPA